MPGAAWRDEGPCATTAWRIIVAAAASRRMGLACLTASAGLGGTASTVSRTVRRPAPSCPPNRLPECSALAFNEVETYAAGAMVQLIGERQNADSRIDHQLATCWESHDDVGCAVRMTGSSKCLLQSGGSDPQRRKIDAAAHAVLAYI